MAMSLSDEDKEDLRQLQDFVRQLPEPLNRDTWTGTVLLEVRPNLTNSVIAKLKFELEKSGAQEFHDFTFPGCTVPVCGTDYTPLELNNRAGLPNDVKLLLNTHFPDFKKFVIAPSNASN
ncbi:uncharacterized protein LOC144862454 [Branchiostoma floridae x Branchiostoma japonicum]